MTPETRSEETPGRLKQLELEHWAPESEPHSVQIQAWTVSGRRIVATTKPSREPELG